MKNKDSNSKTKMCVRTSKHSIKHLTKEKKKFLWKLQNEWSYIANKFVYMYDKEVLTGTMTLMGSKDGSKKGALRSSTVNEIIKTLPFKATSRFIKNAISGGFRSIKSQKILIENGVRVNYTRPKIKSSMMELNEDIVKFIKKDEIKNKNFDGLIKLSSLGLKGKKKHIYIPYKETEFSNQLQQNSKRNKTILLGKTLNISYSTEIHIKKQDSGEVVSLDLNCSDDLISTSTRKHYGTDIRKFIENIQNKKQYSKGWYSAKKSIYHYIDKELKQFWIDHPDCKWLLVENLKNVKNKIRQNQRLNQTSRKIINHWYYAYVLKKLEEFCEMNRVHLRRFPTPYLSQKCSHCGVIDKKNRSGALFHCNNVLSDGKLCNHKDHSGFNSCDNVVNLFFHGAYRPVFQSKLIDDFHIRLFF